jgi:hypothetical protein
MQDREAFSPRSSGTLAPLLLTPLPLSVLAYYVCLFASLFETGHEGGPAVVTELPRGSTPRSHRYQRPSSASSVPCFSRG